MNSDGRVDELVFLGEFDCTVERPWPGPAADRDDPFNAGLPRPRNHRLAVGTELLPFEMGVGIYEHGSRSSIFTCESFPKSAARNLSSPICFVKSITYVLTIGNLGVMSKL